MTGRALTCGLSRLRVKPDFADLEFRMRIKQAYIFEGRLIPVVDRFFFWNDTVTNILVV